MKKMPAIAVIAAVSICMGQYLEKTIWLYDSFPTLGEPYVALHNPTTNRIYAAHYDSNTVPVIADPIHTDLELSMDYALHATSEITFTVVVSNAGPNAADGTVVSNTVSVNLTGATGNCVASGGASCSADSSGSMTVTNFPVGGVATYTLHGMLAN